MAVRINRPTGGTSEPRWLIGLAGVIVVATSLVIASHVSLPSAAQGLGVVAFVALALWMFLSEHMEWPTVALGVYLGCVDGFVKLSTGSSLVSTGRDLLIAALALGFLSRAALRGQRLAAPPMAGWAIAYAIVVLLQLVNPASSGLSHTVAALRPHLEFVPLFFLGYALVQTERRLRNLFILLSAFALLNGCVAFVQLNLTTKQLASWGPGYSKKVNGTGDVSGRVFTDEAGQVRTRPFGLGGDAGASGLIGVVSLGGALALLALAARSRTAQLGSLLAIGPPLAIITGQSRTSVVAGVVVVLVFVVLATSAARLVPTLAAVLLGIGVTLAVFSFIGHSSGSGVFDRYKTITPTSLGATTDRSRSASFEAIPRLLREHPFGGGLGFVGPAASLASKTVTPRGLDGETGPSFLISEVGILGLLILLGLNLRLLGGAFLWCRRMEPSERILVSGVAAGVAGVFTMWASSAPMVVSPAAPYFWFAAGVLAYWLAATARKRQIGASL